MEKDCFTLAKSKGKGGKGKSAGSLDEAEASGPETLQLVDLACVCLENRVVIGSGTIVAKRRSLWTVVRAVSAAPEITRDDCPMQIEEPRSCMTAAGEPVQDEGSRVLRIGGRKKDCIVA